MTESTLPTVSPPIAQIYRAGQALKIQPATAALQRALQTLAHVAVQRPDHTLLVARGPLPLAHEGQVCGQPALVCRAGLEPVVHTVLAREGYRIETIDPPLAPLPLPREAPLHQFDIIDRPLLDWLRQHERGLIRYAADFVDPVHLLAQIALAWPDHRIGIVVTRIQETRHVRDRLRAYGIAAAAANSDNRPPDTWPPDIGPVAICTPAGLSYNAVRVEWLDLVIVLDAREITSKRGRFCISFATRARLFGLLDLAARPAPLERDYMSSLFGFDQITIPRHGHRERLVEVLGYPIRGGARLPAKVDALIAKRRGIWHHAVRNRQVARIAQALRAGRADELQRLLPSLAGRASASRPNGVVVLVENIEHALVLGRRLPGWAVLTGLDVCTDGYSDEERQVLRPPSPFGEANPLYAIVTATGLGALDLTHVGVVVRADGGVGLPALDVQALIEPAGDGRRPLLLIDFHDQHHALLRRRSRQRQAAYVQRGWFAPGIDPVQGRVEQFLASRLKEAKR